MSLVDTFIEVRLKTDEDFLKIKETLTRIGVASKKEKKLYQSCHILHKQGKYYIVHFKELFALDGKPTDFTGEDSLRRNAIAALLVQSGDSVSIVGSRTASLPKAPLNQIKILPFKEKNQWERSITWKKEIMVEIIRVA
jgi:hypothetical protein